MMKIIIVSSNFREKRFWTRWKMLAEKHPDIEVVLLAPKTWTEGRFKGYTFGKKINYKGEEFCCKNFRVLTIRTKQNRFGDWTTKDFEKIFKSNKDADFIYFIGHHSQRSMKQCINAQKKFCKNARMLTFTMRSDISLRFNHNDTLKHRILSWINIRLNRFNVKNSDAIFCHYPDAAEAIKREGFKGPIFLNTQIGVDANHFSFTQVGRDKIRKKYNIGDAFLFGSASRFNKEKGIFWILESLPRDFDWKYMILGSGTKEETEAIVQKAKELKLLDRIIMPGLIGWEDLPSYMSALDCGLHVPITTKRWKETFSLALVQMISVGVPVIGSNSGSVPYQCGCNDLIVPENDAQALSTAIVRILNNEINLDVIKEKQKKYVINNFDYAVINDMFLKDIKLLTKRKQDYDKKDL